MSCSAHLRLLEFDTSVPPRTLRDIRATRSGRILDAILRHRHWLLRAENAVARELLGPLTAAERTLLMELARLDPDAPLSAAGVRVIDRFRRRIEEIMRIGQTDMVLTGFRRFGELAETEIRVQAAIFARHGLGTLDFSGVDPRMIVDQPLGGRRWVGRMDLMWRDLDVGIKRDLAAGLALGENPNVTARRFRERLNGNKRRAVLIARSEMQRVSNRTAIETYGRHSDIISGIQWIATLDDRTCMICAPLDGEVFQVGSLPGGGPPAHPGCRCAVGPILRGEAPPGQIFYRDWFAGQDAGFQRSWLGERRFELFQAGKVNIDSFSRDLRVLPIAELPVLDAAA